jgi:hypothetical protein
MINAAAKMMSLVDMMAHRIAWLDKFYARQDAASNALRGLFL